VLTLVGTTVEGTIHVLLDSHRLHIGHESLGAQVVTCAVGGKVGPWCCIRVTWHPAHLKLLLLIVVGDHY
jgi:hypothetical protein